ncbi:MAG: AEC family transporter, partial [Promethearchaeota archaeon]
ISFVKLIFYPCIAYRLLLYLSIDPLVKAIIIIESAMPSMASTSILVQKYGGDMNLATTAVFFTTLISIFSIPLILKFLIL